MEKPTQKKGAEGLVAWVGIVSKMAEDVLSLLGWLSVT